MCYHADQELQRTLDLRFRHGIHALEIHLRFADLGREGTELRADVESSCSSLGRIVRIAWNVVEKRAWRRRRVEFNEVPSQALQT